MIDWRKWIEKQEVIYTAPLFSEENLVVETFLRGSREVLKRNEEFDETMINIVETGLKSKDWLGIIYIMHWNPYNQIIPLYWGKTEKKGTKKPISSNIENIRKNNDKFARWGYNLDYHIGGLSHAIFGGKGYKKIEPRYQDWASMLFSELNPPILKEKVYVTLISWYNGMRGPSGHPETVPAVEKHLIAFAGAEYPNVLLNKDGR